MAIPERKAIHISRRLLRPLEKLVLPFLIIEEYIDCIAARSRPPETLKKGVIGLGTYFQHALRFQISRIFDAMFEICFGLLIKLCFHIERRFKPAGERRNGIHRPDLHATKGWNCSANF